MKIELISKSVDIYCIIHLNNTNICLNKKERTTPYVIVIKPNISCVNLGESLNKLAEFFENKITSSGIDTQNISFEELYRWVYNGSISSTNNQYTLNAIFNSAHRKISTMDSLTTKMDAFDMMRDVFTYPLISNSFLVCEQCKTSFSHGNYFCVECTINDYRTSLKSLAKPLSHSILAAIELKSSVANE